MILPKVLPCPFCGGEAEEEWRDDDFRYRCLECDTKGPTTDYEHFELSSGDTSRDGVLLFNTQEWNGRKEIK